MAGGGYTSTSYYNDDKGVFYNDDNAKIWAESEEGINSYFVIFLSLLALTLVLAKSLHARPRLASVLPEVGMTIIVGVIAGAIIFLSPMYSADASANNYDDTDDDDDQSIRQGVADGLLSFSPRVFFFILLPPIIFNSGYNLKLQVFFRLITPISIFACIGTAISTIVVAVMLELLKNANLTGNFKPYFTELLTFGALISATDPVSTLAIFQAKKVDPQLFYLVFGESVLNDAVGLVLFKSLSKFVEREDGGASSQVAEALLEFLIDFSISFFGSMVLGFCAGIACAVFFKKVEMRDTPLLELSLFFLIMYLPFFLAELIGLSGIVTILFTGIFAKRYATENLSLVTEQNADSLFRVSAHIAETSIFLELGLSVFGITYYGSCEWKFAGWAILACLLGRAMNIYPLRTLYNASLQNTSKEEEEKEVGTHVIKSLGDDLDDDDDDQQHYQLHASTSLTPLLQRDLKIQNNTAHMLWFSGLRGAVAYACAKTFPNIHGNRTYFVFTTMVIVLFTVFTFGCTTEVALNKLGIETDVDEDEYMKKNDTETKMKFFSKFENDYILKLVKRVQQNNLQSIDTQGQSWIYERDFTNSMTATSINMPPSLSNESSGVVRARASRSRKGSLYDFGLSLSSQSSYFFDMPQPLQSGNDSSSISTSGRNNHDTALV